MRYGSYAPENFDLTFQGTVTVRRALQMSLNVPAVAVLDKVGASRFAARLAQAGRLAGAAQGRSAWARHGPRRRRHQAHRSGRALCRAGAPRHDGAAHRAARRRGGERRPRAGCSTRSPPGMSAISCSARRRRRTRPAAASPTRPAPPTAIATPGPSGFDGRRTIGVWVGRPDGAPVPGLIGRGGGGADPVRCLRAHRQVAGAAAGGAERRARLRRTPNCRRRCSASVPAPLAGRGQRAAASHHVPTQRRAARACEPTATASLTRSRSR